MSRQKTISVSIEEYRKLRDLKEKTEKKLGAKMDWGAFLVGFFSDSIVHKIVRGIIDKGDLDG